MKKLASLVLLVAVFACKNVEQFKAPIETLSADWASTTQSITDFSNMLNTEKANLDTWMANMPLAADVVAKLDNAGKAKLAEFEATAKTQSEGLNGMVNEVTSFVSNWASQEGVLKGLVDGLASQKLPADAATQITTLTDLITNGKTSVTSWGEKLTAAKTAISTLSSGFDAWKATLAPAKK